MEIPRLTISVVSTCWVAIGTSLYADYFSTIRADTPIAYYRFEEAPDANIVRDSSGNGYDSVDFKDAELGLEGVCGGSAVRFDGDGYIVVGLQMDPNDPEGNGAAVGLDDFSIEAWVKVHSEEVPQVFVGQMDGDGKGRSNLLMNSDGFLGSFIGGNTTASNVEPRLDTWYHFVMTVDGEEDELFFYVDGMPSGTSPQAAGSNGVESANGNWVIGSNKLLTLQFVQGIVDEVAVYTYRLDDPNGDDATFDSRVADHYGACVPASGLTGDFSRDGMLNAVDIDALMQEVAAGSNNSVFDLDADGFVNDNDRDRWLAAAGIRNGFAGAFLVGDSNLDGHVNAADLNALGLSWEQERHNWTNGNFSSAAVDAIDLNAMALNWQQSVPLAGAVPEPSTCLGFLFGTCFWCCVKSRLRSPSRPQ